MSNGNAGPSLGDVAGAASFVVGLIAAWLYVSGWTYAFYYYDQFGIPLLLTEIPREYFFVYGGLAVWKNLLWAVLIAVPSAVLVAAAVRYRGRIGRGGLVGLAVLAILAAFVLARQAGIHTAHGDYATQRGSDYRAFPRVVVEASLPSTGGSGAKAVKIAASGCARLVLFSKERVFLIRPRRDAPALSLHTHVLPWSQIEAMSITDNFTSCP